MYLLVNVMIKLPML